LSFSFKTSFRSLYLRDKILLGEKKAIGAQFLKVKKILKEGFSLSLS